MVHIKRNIPAKRKDLVEAFREQSTATVHEAMGKRGAMKSSIKPIASGMKICGQAITVKCSAGDNLMLIKAISMAEEGQAVVADMGDISDSGPFGEVLAVECVTKGIAGLITNGSIRDSKEVKALNFPVFCTSLSIIGTTKASLGLINHPVSCGNVVVNPGDIVLGDDDGVVVIPLEEAEEVLNQSRMRIEKEKKVMEQLKDGKTLFDIYGYQKVLDELGCIEE